MRAERVLRDAAAPLIGKIVPPLELEDLHQEGRIALWLKGEGLPDSHKVTIARGAMIDALRRARWVSRVDYRDGAAWEMASYDAWEETPDVLTDCHAASFVAVRQCIARMYRLAERERQVLLCLLDGMDHDEIAACMGVSHQLVSHIVLEVRRCLAPYLEGEAPAPRPVRTIPALERAPRTLRGVTRSGKRWIAEIRRGGKKTYLGTFDTPEEAHAAYVAAKREVD